MKTTLRSTLIATLLMVMAGPLSAACFADYKAKRDNPLRLHYGVIELPGAACADPALARAQIAKRIGADGWKLLKFLSIFDESGLEEKKDSAGKFYLRF
ncbi:MAG: hypothetical protein ACC619_02650 [Paracoccaceae bacterium]